MAQDLDKGGVYTEWIRTYFGPTTGWLYIQVANTNLANAVVGFVENVTVGGITTLSPTTTVAKVNVASAVTIQLNSSVPGTQPTQYLGLPITIIDVGGNATSFPITILPSAGELIMGQASLTINVSYGAYTLIPKVGGGWGALS